MDVMQTISDFKQNLAAHPAAKPGTAAASPGTLANSAQTQAAASSTSSTTGSTTITANDFLQLLVAEMKNQDPTADQDPNAYIDQLVQVNSLQQLISINQDLTPASTTSGTPTGGVAPAPGGQATLGSADGTLSGTLARSMTPPAAQPQRAPLAGAAAVNPPAADSGTPLNLASLAAQARNAPNAASAAEKAAASRW